MTKEKANNNGLYVEQYADGYIVADYSGSRGDAAYCGKSMIWKRQPVGLTPVFKTEDEAYKACDRA